MTFSQVYGIYYFPDQHIATGKKGRTHDVLV